MTTTNNDRPARTATFATFARAIARDRDAWHATPERARIARSERARSVAFTRRARASRATNGTA